MAKCKTVEAILKPGGRKDDPNFKGTQSSMERKERVF